MVIENNTAVDKALHVCVGMCRYVCVLSINESLERITDSNRLHFEIKYN